MTLTRKLLAPTAASGWSPTDLGANLLAWYDASDSGSLTLSGADVTQWNDLSGNSNTLTQGTATRYPQYSATSFNSSYPGLTFDGSNDALSNLAFAGTTGSVLCAFGVAVLESGGATNGRIVSYALNGNVDSNNNAAADVISRNSSTEAVFAYRTGGTASKSSKAVTYGTPFRFMSIFDGTNHTMYVNNSAGTPVASSGSFGNTSVDFYIGNTNGFVEGWKGVISEVIISISAPDSTTRDDIDAYLVAKWGL